MALRSANWLLRGLLFQACLVACSASDGDDTGLPTGGSKSPTTGGASTTTGGITWAVGDLGTVLRSGDSGASWTRITVPTEENLFVIGLDPGGESPASELRQSHPLSKVGSTQRCFTAHPARYSWVENAW